MRYAETAGAASPLYEWLLARAEEESRHPMPLPGNTAWLAALRAGRPVDVPTEALPQWACEQEKAPSCFRRATVSPDGSATFYEGDPLVWAAEHGL